MNAPERVRAFLTARAANPSAETRANIAISGFQDPQTGAWCLLTEADLEALLQTVDILAHLISQQNPLTPEQVLQYAEEMRPQ